MEKELELQILREMNQQNIFFQKIQLLIVAVAAVPPIVAQLNPNPAPVENTMLVEFAQPSAQMTLRISSGATSMVGATVTPLTGPKVGEAFLDADGTPSGKLMDRGSAESTSLKPQAVRPNTSLDLRRPPRHSIWPRLRQPESSGPEQASRDPASL